MTIKEHILSLLKEAPMSSGQLSKKIAKTGKSKSAVRREISILAREGLVTKIDKDYQLIDSQEETTPQAKTRQIQDGKILILEKKVKNLKKELEVALQHSYMEDAIINAVEKNMQGYKPVHPQWYDIPDAKPGSEVLILNLADPHFYLTVIPDTVGGINEYNPHIATLRIQRLIEKVLEFAFTHNKERGYRRLAIFGLGDFIEFGIHDTFNNTPGTATDSLFLGIHVIAAGILELARYFERIDFHGVPGNHGRMTDKPTFNMRYNNFDYIAYNVMAIELKQQPNVFFHTTKSFFQIVDVNGWKFFLQHGENIRGWSGYPYYGMDRDAKASEKLVYDRKKEEKRLTEYLKSFMTEWASANCPSDMSPEISIAGYDYMMLAHFHVPAVVPFGSRNIFVTGSTTGVTEFSASKKYMACRPSQKLLSVDENYGISWESDIYPDEDEISEQRYFYDPSKEFYEQDLDLSIPLPS